MLGKLIGPELFPRNTVGLTFFPSQLQKNNPETRIKIRGTGVPWQGRGRKGGER
jgi:hypothetical protein